MEWYEVQNIAEIDTPAFLLYPSRIRQNIAEAVRMRGDVSLLRPHIKTTKTPEVIRMMSSMGINKFKCATIAEAELLAREGVGDVLMAYQPTGPKIERLRLLVAQYPATRFAALVDNMKTARDMSEIFARSGSNNGEGNVPRNAEIEVYLDLNVGQNRTGLAVSDAFRLYEKLQSIPNITVAGLHVYDGHIRDQDFDLRMRRCNEAFEPVGELVERIPQPITVVAGGSPTFPIHCHRPDVQCSPGTFVYWDYGYATVLPEQPFIWAALVACRIISRLDRNTVCVDLGHKAIASENPFPRVHFLNLPGATQISHSEEHLVLQIPQHNLMVGDVLYGVPIHICPTCNLYDSAQIVMKGRVSHSWKILARDRVLSI